MAAVGVCDKLRLNAHDCSPLRETIIAAPEQAGNRPAATVTMTGMGLVVNGEKVDDAVLAREAESLRQRFSQLSEQEQQTYGLTPEAIEQRAVEWARENVIEQTLLRQEALRDAAPLPEEDVRKAFAEAVERYGGEEKFKEADIDEDRLRSEVETRLRVDALIGRITAKARPPKPREVAEFYRKNKARFKTPETLRAAHIVKHVEKDVSAEQAREAIDKLYAELRAGRVFEDIADEQSDCPGNGGDLGWFPRGRMVPEFEDVVFEMKVGETSEVFQTVFGFHIAKLIDRRPEGLQPLKEVASAIEEQLMNDRRTQALETAVDKLRERAAVEDNASIDAAVVTRRR